MTALRRGQSTVEYLMTYGWVILIVVIVAAVLLALGVFDSTSYTTTAAVGFTEFQIPVGGFKLGSDGVLILQVVNQVGGDVLVTGSMATVSSVVQPNRFPINGGNVLGPKQTAVITYIGLPKKPAGSPYSARVNITYTNVKTGLAGFVVTGTLTGFVS
ncbi:MAG: hypothetical protein HY369_04895 [Candidatus Aenigmarchaeota archaeon]|nr:hypothetical protein [Candidatus Aenigmarchaeota archaeon]